jgi:hypothetical protein
MSHYHLRFLNRNEKYFKIAEDKATFYMCRCPVPIPGIGGYGADVDLPSNKLLYHVYKKFTLGLHGEARVSSLGTQPASTKPNLAGGYQDTWLTSLESRVWNVGHVSTCSKHVAQKGALFHFYYICLISLIPCNT